MNAFTSKQLPSEESFGNKLRQIRLSKDLKLEQLSQTLGIRREYLAALEDEQFENIPSGLYGKSFLKKYAQKLGIPKKEISAQINLMNSKEEDDPFSQKIAKKRDFIIFPKFLKNSLIVLAVFACLAYLIFYFNQSLRPPQLNIIHPAGNLLITDNQINIQGWTEPETEIKINEVLVLSDDGGYFSQVINLKKGLNTITISAKKKYSRENIELRQILVE